MSKYKFLLFDADNTILDFSRSEEAAIKMSVSHFGIEPTEELCKSYSRINERLWKALEKKEIDRATLKIRRFELFVKENSLLCEPSLVAEKYLEMLSLQPYVLNGARELLLSLKDSFEIYIITNGTASIQKSRVKASGIMDLYKKIYISEEIGFDKPDIRYFQRVFEDIEGFEKEKAIVIGDSLSSDIRGAVFSGVDSCYFTPTGNMPQGDIKPTYIATTFDQIYDILK